MILTDGVYLLLLLVRPLLKIFLVAHEDTILAFCIDFPTITIPLPLFSFVDAPWVEMWSVGVLQYICREGGMMEV